MKLIVDRIEDNYVVCENENNEIVNIPLSKINISLKEGDIFEMEDDFVSKILVQDMIERKEKIEELTKNLWKN